MFGLPEALMSFIRRQVGLRTDAASSTGSLHAKVKDIKDTIGDSADVRADNTVMGWLASPIKSIQRGTTIANATTNVAISFVNTSKAVVIANAIPGAYTQLEGGGCNCSLTSGTSLQLCSGFYNPDIFSSAKVSWQVIEFY